jgi:hypothetical protein
MIKCMCEVLVASDDGGGGQDAGWSSWRLIFMISFNKASSIAVSSRGEFKESSS